MDSKIKVIKTKSGVTTKLVKKTKGEVETKAKSQKSNSQKNEEPKRKKIGIIFVCTGNTCRSPVAEFVCKYYLKKKRKLSKYRVSSAGTDAYENEPMSSLSREVLQKNNVPCAEFSSTHLTLQLERENDFVICMTAGHKVRLQGAKNVYTVSEITGYGDVLDPYGGTSTEYDEMYDYLSYAMKDIIVFIEKQSNQV